MKTTGTVLSWNDEKGYGFITSETGEKLFVHFTSIASMGVKKLDEGRLVDFEVIEGPKGPQAVNVVPG
jgi:CspA family cold shock protein